MQYASASRPDLRPRGYGLSLSGLAYRWSVSTRANAKAVLKMQINKSDRNDAIGIARILQTGWFKEVHVKDIDSHSVRALLASRALLVKIKRDLENHVRGLLKNLGLVIGRAKFNVFAVRAEELIEGRPELIAAIRPLLEARDAVGQQVSELDRNVMKLARHDAQIRRFMTVPGVGPITALAFKATIDDPARFARSRSVGAYVGLTSRRHASGEVDWTGRISKCGDAVDRRNRVQLVEEGNCCLARALPRSCQTGGKRRPCRDHGDGEFDRFFASV
jgi:transposase